MATDARGHIAPAGGETPRRQVVNDLSLSINDPVMVANDTARAQALVDLGSSAARPLVVRQQDTAQYWEHNGTDWRPIYGRPDRSLSFAINTALWTSGAGRNSVSRVGPRWLLDLSLHSANGGAFSAGNAALGSIPAEARVSGAGYVAAAGRYLPGGLVWMPCAVELNLASGAVTMSVPTTSGSIAAGQFRVQAQVTWDAY